MGLRMKRLKSATIQVRQKCFLPSGGRREHGGNPIQGRRYMPGDVVNDYTGPFNYKWMEILADPVGEAAREELERKKTEKERQLAEHADHAATLEKERLEAEAAKLVAESMPAPEESPRSGTGSAIRRGRPPKKAS